MGVNMAGFCISDDLVCQEAAKQEVVRRYYHALGNEAATQADPIESHRIAMTMAKLGITKEYRYVVRPALNLEAETGAPAAAMQLGDGRIVTGKTSPLLGCCSAMLLNALKLLAGIDQEVQLLAPSSIKPIQTLKVDHLGARNPRLHTDEVLIALSVSADTDENARKALEELAHLRDCEVHTTTILGSVDTQIFRNLGLQVTSEPVYARKTLFKK